MSRQRVWPGLVVAAVVTGALLVVLVLRATGSDDAFAPGGPPPQEATETMGLLTSSDPATRQSAFDPEVAALGGEDVPELDAGSTIQLDEDGWRSEIDGFANATGDLVDADGSSQPAEIGFAHADDRWLIVYVSEQERER